MCLMVYMLSLYVIRALGVVCVYVIGDGCLVCVFPMLVFGVCAFMLYVCCLCCSVFLCVYVSLCMMRAGCDDNVYVCV